MPLFTAAPKSYLNRHFFRLHLILTNQSRFFPSLSTKSSPFSCYPPTSPVPPAPPPTPTAPHFSLPSPLIFLQSPPFPTSPSSSNLPFSPIPFLLILLLQNELLLSSFSHFSYPPSSSSSSLPSTFPHPHTPAAPHTIYYLLDPLFPLPLLQLQMPLLPSLLRLELPFPFNFLPAWPTSFSCPSFPVFVVSSPCGGTSMSWVGAAL